MSEPVIVNPHLVAKLLDPWASLADDERAVRRYEFEASSEAAVRGLIRRELAGYTDDWRPAKREKAIWSLRYYLLHEPEHLEGLFESILPPIPATEPGELFWHWYWEEAFPDLELAEPTTTTYKVVADFHEPNGVRL